MKKVLYLAIAAFVLWSCGGSGGDDPDPDPTPTVNNAPTTPSLSSPTDGLLCIDNTVTFSWSASTDADGDSITYNLQIATDTGFSNIVEDINTSTTTRTVTLDAGTAYYWRVNATDGEDASSYTSTYDFYTEGEGVTNYLPFSPDLVSPELSAVISTSTTTLEWSCSDVDGDTLSYTVYLDTVSTPTTVVSTDQSGTTFETAALDASTTYYWKVVASDGNGGTTIGQVWSFTTD